MLARSKGPLYLSTVYIFFGFVVCAALIIGLMTRDTFLGYSLWSVLTFFTITYLPFIAVLIEIIGYFHLPVFLILAPAAVIMSLILGFGSTYAQSNNKPGIKALRYCYNAMTFINILLVGAIGSVCLIGNIALLFLPIIENTAIFTRILPLMLVIFIVSCLLLWYHYRISHIWFSMSGKHLLDSEND